ncbi:MAG: flagellar motor switch protein FliN [Solirubrobacteraceae bacterium]|nr:flagellar motor switch protein FliN [Solirubrobacteraceae bacterium]MEA2288867.1 flagellar motor switch protein FliN [Solirubrobacteraceae bacterium]
MNVDDALIRLGESTSEAVVGVMEMFAPGAAETGPVVIVPPGSQPLQAVPTPAVATSVSYVDGVTGGNIFVMPLSAARALAAAMMGEAPPEDDATELTELESSAVGEAMNQMMAAGASATSAVLGTEVEIAPPDTRVLESLDHALDGHDGAAHLTSAVFTVFGAPCRLVQLVPNAFVIRMTRALDEMGAEYLSEPSPGAEGGSPGLDDQLRAIPVRVWAELGRRKMPIGELVGTPAGAVLELDREAEELVDLYVNGMRFATGRLVVCDGGEWAVQIESLVEGEPVAA